MLYTLLEHRKLKRLAAILGESRVHLCGHLFALEVFVAREFPEGDLSDATDAEIEEAAQWEGLPGKFVEACISVRFIDRTGSPETGIKTLLHDWQDWAPEHVKKRWRRAKQTARERAASGQAELFDHEGESSGVNGSMGARGAPNGRTVSGQCPPDGRMSREEQSSAVSESSESASSQRPTHASPGRPKGTAADKVAALRKTAEGDLPEIFADAAVRADPDAEGPIETPLIVSAAKLVASRVCGDYKTLPVILKASELLKAAGDTDSGYQVAVGRAIQKRNDGLEILTRVVVRCVARGKAIQNPGGWMRTALTKLGVQI